MSDYVLHPVEEDFQTATIDDVLAAVPVIRQHISPAPLIRSYPLENFWG